MMKMNEFTIENKYHPLTAPAFDDLKKQLMQCDSRMELHVEKSWTTARYL